MGLSHGGEHGRDGKERRKESHVDIHVGEDEVTRVWRKSGVRIWIRRILAGSSSLLRWSSRGDLHGKKKTKYNQKIDD